MARFKVNKTPPMLSLSGRNDAPSKAITLRIPVQLLSEITEQSAGSRNLALIYLIERAWRDIKKTGMTINISYD